MISFFILACLISFCLCQLMVYSSDTNLEMSFTIDEFEASFSPGQTPICQYEVVGAGITQKGCTKGTAGDGSQQPGQGSATYTGALEYDVVDVKEDAVQTEVTFKCWFAIAIDSCSRDIVRQPDWTGSLSVAATTDTAASVTLKSETGGFDLKLNTVTTWNFDGPRGQLMDLQENDLLAIDTKQGVEHWYCNRVILNDGSSIRLRPVMSGDALEFTSVYCKEITIRQGGKVTVEFPSDYEPDVGEKLTFDALLTDNLEGGGTDEPLELGFVSNDYMKERNKAEGFVIVGKPKITTVSKGGNIYTAAEVNIEFTTTEILNSRKMTTSPEGNFIDNNLWFLVAGVGACIVCIIAIIVTICFVRKVKQETLENSLYSDTEIGNPMQSARFSEHPTDAYADYNDAGTIATTMTNVNTPTSMTGTLRRQPPPPPSDYNASVYAQAPEVLRSENDPWEIDPSLLEMGRVLGEGAYGSVCQANYHGQVVAVKRMKAELLKPQDIEAFKKEAKLMKSLTESPHPNVVGLVGVNTDESKGELFIVTEFCGGGACDDYLKRTGHLLTQRQRLSMMVAAARGVSHLHSMSIIHRDLACRNFLLTSQGGLKVADFGMSRDTQEDGNQTKCEVGPLRYMAPEAMAKRLYSVQTDIWAFGVVMWEIESNAATPYGDKALTMVAIGVAKEGLRLDQPEGCPDAVYQLMHHCWQHRPEDRINFDGIVQGLIDAANNEPM